MVKVLLLAPPTNEQLEQMMNRALADAHKAISDEGYDPVVYANILMCFGLRVLSSVGGKLFEEASQEAVRLAFSGACFPNKEMLH